MVERSHDIQPSPGLTSSTHICHETVRPLQALPARPAPHQCALAGLRNSRSMQLHMVWTTKMYDITVYSSASFRAPMNVIATIIGELLPSFIKASKNRQAIQFIVWRRAFHFFRWPSNAHSPPTWLLKHPVPL